MEKETIKVNYNGQIIDFVVKVPEEEIEKNNDQIINTEKEKEENE